MNYREEGQEDEVIEDYQLIHKPWTAVSGVIRREFEPIEPGSYGYAFLRALEVAKKKALVKKYKHAKAKK